MEEIVVSMRHISKSFGGIKALEDANLELHKGEVLGLIGENGAGKSTLMNILSGVLMRDGGDVEVFGKTVHYKGPADALNDGVCMIHQETNLMKKLSVADNIFIGRETKKCGILNRMKDQERTKDILKELELNVDPSILVEKLTIAKMQMVEIAKGLSSNAKILIMDEPTAALANQEIEDLFKLIRQLKSKGVALIYISHRLEELLTITDNITVMRDGTYIDTIKTNECSMDMLISKMVGRVIYSEPKQKSNVIPGAPVVLEAKGMSSAIIHDVSFQLRKGEILGFAGLMGAGRTELARLVFGADSRSSGSIYKNGKKIQIRKPKDAVEHGIGYLSENRKDMGLAIKLSISDNVAMTCWPLLAPNGIVKKDIVDKRVREETKKIAVKTPSVDQLVKNLSGGNQQKVVIAKWLIRDCDILIFDEPTRGIDVGAKNEIYKLMNKLVEDGKSIIMISSEMSELLRMSDRILVMREGRITGELDISEATQENIMRYATIRNSILN